MPSGGRRRRRRTSTSAPCVPGGRRPRPGAGAPGPSPRRGHRGRPSEMALAGWFDPLPPEHEARLAYTRILRAVVRLTSSEVLAACPSRPAFQPAARRDLVTCTPTIVARERSRIPPRRAARIPVPRACGRGAHPSPPRVASRAHPKAHTVQQIITSPRRDRRQPADTGNLERCERLTPAIPRSSVPVTACIRAAAERRSLSSCRMARRPPR